MAFYKLQCVLLLLNTDLPSFRFCSIFEQLGFTFRVPFFYILYEMHLKIDIQSTPTRRAHTFIRGIKINVFIQDFKME